MKKDKVPQLQFIFCIIGICLLFFTMFISFFNRYSGFQVTVKEEISRDLKNTTKVSLDILRQTINEAYLSIERIAELCEIPDGTGKENWWKLLDTQDSKNILAFADLKGNFYYGDHKVKILEKESIRKYELAEERYLSEIYQEDFGTDGEDYIVLSVPIKVGQNIKGYVCIEYSTVYLGQLVNTAETQNRGATMVIDGQGHLIATYEGMEEFETIYDMFEEKNFYEGDSLESIRKSFKDEEAGYNSYYGVNKDYKIQEEKERYVYHQHTGIGDWVILTLVIQESYDPSLQKLQKGSVQLAFTILIASIASFLLLICAILIWKQQKMEGFRDSLTGVYTRHAAERIVKRNHRQLKERQFTCCMFLDVDHFKAINDTMGHKKGDEVLQKVAEILCQEARRYDIVSRFGGDEFNIWCANIQDKEDALIRGEELLQAVRLKSNVHISVGITMFQIGMESYEEILDRADKALYEAKNRGRNQYAFLEKEEEK